MPKEHKFWDKEPAKLGDNNNIITEIPRRESIKLPESYTIEDLQDEEVDEIYRLLKNNYIGSLDGLFAHEYSLKFVRWIVKKARFNLCLKYNGQLVGFILGTAHKINVRDVVTDFLGVNFLCIKASHRKINLAPCLISDITRRSTETGRVSAIFTGGVSYPFNFSTAQYYHLPISMTKLIKMDFLPEWLPGPHEIEDEDSFVPLSIDNLKETYTIKNAGHDMQIYDVEDIDEFWKNHACVEDVIYTFVQTNKEGAVIGFISFIVHFLMGHDDEKIKTAFVFDWSTTPTFQLFNGLLNSCIKMEFDLINCLGIGGLVPILKRVGFYEGTGFLNYSFYNFETSAVDPDKLKFVMF